MDEIRAGRMKPVPAEAVLEMLDRIAPGGPADPDPEWLAELERPIEETEAGTAGSRPAEEVFSD